jgi:hypothetical protein
VGWQRNTGTSALAGMRPDRPWRIRPFRNTVASMTGREERVARNEAASRDINERIEDAHEGATDERYVRMLCECGKESCDRLIAITLPEYERVRSHPRTFAVMRDHVMEDMERVVDETDRFVVVAKREGTPAQVAIEEDPRS